VQVSPPPIPAKVPTKASAKAPAPAPVPIPIAQPPMQNKYDLSSIHYTSIPSSPVKSPVSPKKSNWINKYTKNKSVLSQSLEQMDKEHVQKIKQKEQEKIAAMEKAKQKPIKCAAGSIILMELDCVITNSSWFTFIKSYPNWETLMINKFNPKEDKATIAHFNNNKINLERISRTIRNIKKEHFTQETLNELPKEIDTNIAPNSSNLIKEYIIGNGRQYIIDFLNILKNNGFSLYILPTSMAFYIAALFSIIGVSKDLFNNLSPLPPLPTLEHISNYAKSNKDLSNFLLNKPKSETCDLITYINNKNNPITEEIKNKLNSYYVVDYAMNVYGGINICGLQKRDVNAILNNKGLNKLAGGGVSTHNADDDLYYKKYLKYKQKYLIIRSQ
jgi:hypothetical protein